MIPRCPPAHPKIHPTWDQPKPTNYPKTHQQYDHKGLHHHPPLSEPLKPLQPTPIPPAPSRSPTHLKIFQCPRIKPTMNSRRADFGDTHTHTKKTTPTHIYTQPPTPTLPSVKKRSRNEGKIWKNLGNSQKIEFGLTYKCSFVGFAIEGEGNRESDRLGCPIIMFGVGFIPLVWSIGIEHGSCREIWIWELPPNSHPITWI